MPASASRFADTAPVGPAPTIKTSASDLVLMIGMVGCAIIPHGFSPSNGNAAGRDFVMTRDLRPARSPLMRTARTNRLGPGAWTPNWLDLVACQRKKRAY